MNRIRFRQMSIRWGVVAYELMTLRCAFTSVSLILTRQYARIGAEFKYSAALTDLVSLCMAKVERRVRRVQTKQIQAERRVLTEQIQAERRALTEQIQEQMLQIQTQIGTQV